MTVDTRLHTAVADTKRRIADLAPPDLPGRRLLPALAGSVAALAAIATAVVMWQTAGTMPQSLAQFGTRVEAGMQPTASLTEVNLANALVSLDGTRLANLEVRSMEADATGTLWLTVADRRPLEEGELPEPARLYGFDGTDWWLLDVPYGIWVGVIAGDSNGVWVSTYEGLTLFDGADWTLQTPDDGAPGSWISSATVTPDGELWVYSTGRLVGTTRESTPHWDESPRVSSFDGVAWRHWDATEPGDWEPGHIVVDADGSTWVAGGAAWGDGAAGGVWLLEDTGWVQVWEPTHPLTDFHNGMAIDSAGAVWTTYRDTMLQIIDTAVRVFDASDGIGIHPGEAAINWRPEDLAVRGDEIWVATAGGGISVFDGDTWLTFDEDQGLPHRNVVDIELGPGDDLWLRLGEDGQQVVVFDPGG